MELITKEEYDTIKASEFSYDFITLSVFSFSLVFVLTLDHMNNGLND